VLSAAKCTPDLRQGAKLCDFIEFGLQSLAMLRPSDPPAIIEFGHFSIFPHRRQLLSDGRPITLGGRAFDVLMTLIEASGAVVSKDELSRLARPDRQRVPRLSRHDRGSSASRDTSVAYLAMDWRLCESR
jgi:DNA-binding response OmpR family regulator